MPHPRARPPASGRPASQEAETPSAATTVAPARGVAPDRSGDLTQAPRWREGRRLLRGPLRTLVTGQALGQAGDGFAQIAFAQLVLFEAGAGATPWELAKLLAVTLLPFSLVGPFAGVVIDRWDRRRTMVIVSVVRAALAIAGIAVLAARSQPPAYLAVIVLLSSSRFVLAAKGAALPRTVRPGDLVTANAVSSIAGLVAAFVGAVAASTFVERWPAAGFVAASLAYAAAATSFARLPPVGGGEAPPPIVAGLRRVSAELAEGMHAIALEPAIRRPLVAVWTDRFLVGAGFILLVLIADSRYDLETSGYGLAIAATGLAAFAGTLTAPALARRYQPLSLLSLAFLVAATAAFLTSFAPKLAALVAGIGVAAFAFQVLKILVDALVGRATPDEVRGRVFSAYDVLFNVSFVLAGLILVPLWEPGRERWLLAGLGAAFLAAGALVARSNRTWPFAPPPSARRMPRRWRARGAAVLAGALPALAFPEAGLWWLGFVGLVPALAVVRSAPSCREAGVRAWLGGAGYLLAVHWWLVPNLGPFAVPAALALGALWVLWGIPAWSLLTSPVSPGRLAGALLVVPSGWVVGELIRSWERLGGPFGLLGASQWQTLPVLSLAALGGVWAVSFALVAVNVALGATVLQSSARTRVGALTAAAALAGVGPVWHILRADPEAARTVRIAGVQPGVIHPVKPRFSASEAATLGLAAQRFDLVAWGESSVGLDLRRHPSYLERIVDASRAVGADILVNIDARRGTGGILKAAVLVGPDGPRGRYDKMRLVPFGEYVPLRRVFGWLPLVTRAPIEDRQRGQHLRILESRGVRLGPLICFESAFPDLTRRLTKMGADLIVVQSSTSTFQGSWAPESHASLAAVRAVETARPVLHATLTGVSAAFGADGRRLVWFGTDQRGAYEAEILLTRGTTPYVRFGDWLPFGSIAALLGSGLVAGLRAARGTPDGEAR